MKSKSRIAYVIGLILLNLSTAIFADISSANTTKFYSAKSSVSNRFLQQEPAITNEAEYADFVRRNERASRASSVQSAPSKASEAKKISASSSRTKESVK